MDSLVFFRVGILHPVHYVKKSGLTGYLSCVIIAVKLNQARWSGGLSCVL